MALRLLCLLPICILCALRSLAQTFEPGLLVTSKGDTLRGEIENGFWVEPPLFIRFRPTPESASQLFQPRQLRAVSFAGGRYFRYEALPIDHAANTQLMHLSEGYVTAVRVDTLLAEVLLEGAVPVRRVVWEGTTHYLIRRADQPILELVERKYLRKTGTGSLSVVDGNNYRNQLSLFFRDCPAAVTAATTAPFTAEGIVGVVQAYNNACRPEQQPAASWLALAAPRRRVAFQGGLLAGVRYNRIESPSYDLAGPCSDCRPHPFAGLYAELFQPSRTAAIYGELSLSSFRSQGRAVTGYDLISGPAYSTFDYRALLTTARLGARYFIPLPREQQVLFGAAFELNWVVSPVATVTSGPPYKPDSFDQQYASTTLLPNLVVGWRSRRFTVSLDGQLYDSSEGNDSIFGTVFFGTNFATRLGVTYRLGGNPDAAAGSASKR